MKEYFEKIKEMADGYNATCWECVGFRVDLKNSKAYFDFAGYKDLEAKLAGKECKGKICLEASELEVFAIYSAMHDAVVSFVLNHPDFSNSTYKTVEE